MHRLKKGESRVITVRGRTDKGGLSPVADKGNVSSASSDPKVLLVEPLGGDRFKASYVGPGSAKVTNLFTLNGKSEPFRDVMMFECLGDTDEVITGVGSELSLT